MHSMLHSCPGGVFLRSSTLKWTLAGCRQAIQSLYRLCTQLSASTTRLWTFGSPLRKQLEGPVVVPVTSVVIDCTTDSSDLLNVAGDGKAQAGTAAEIEIDVHDLPATRPRTGPRLLCVKDFLCRCVDFPSYKRIVLTVALSKTYWCTERQKRDLTELAQAFSTYNEALSYCSSMIAAAHKWLYRWSGDVDLAFQDFVALCDDTPRLEIDTGRSCRPHEPKYQLETHSSTASLKSCGASPSSWRRASHLAACTTD
ncbi:hypothetical protein BBJ28_00023047 [Nothophytophthora sp. Chile5]|nr:hypothetical protein BBJ28_00023047 [Nothophytophthora sp. Chile5]